MQNNVAGSADDQAFMIQALLSCALPQALHVAASLDIAELLAGGPRTADELAVATAADTDALNRVLRFLVANGVFQQSDDERFELNGRGQLLRSGVRGSIRAGVFYLYDGAVWAAMGGLTDAVRTGKPAFEMHHGVGLFEYIESHPELASQFDEFMTQRKDHATIARSRDFSQTRLLVDVGGGHGATLVEILKAHPALRGVLFDLPHVIERAGLSSFVPDISKRLTLTSGDFFEAVPPGGDVYLLEDVLHDWNDEDCLRILSTCRRAMRQTAELLIAERVPPVSGAPLLVLSVDVIGLGLGIKERTEVEFRALLEKSGFRVTGIQRVTPNLALVSAEAA